MRPTKIPQSPTQTKTSFQAKLAIAISFFSISIVVFIISSYTTSYSSNSNTPLLPPPPPSFSPTPTPTPTPKTGCCNTICALIGGMQPTDEFPPTFTTCVQSTADECKGCGAQHESVCAGGFNVASGDMYQCLKVEWHKDKKCDTTKTPPQCKPKGCCEFEDQNGVPQCYEDQTKEECNNLGGTFDGNCQVCDPITNSCRDELCCQFNAQGQSFCSQVEQTQECTDQGGVPGRGQCNQTTGKCEKTGCCQLPEKAGMPQCSGSVTQDECSSQGGSWNGQASCDHETGSCKKLGCCQAGTPSAPLCTQSTQEDCPFAWAENAECNYGTGKCGSNEPIMSIDIRPDSDDTGNKYLHPTTQEDLYCTGRVENYTGWNVALEITGFHGQPFQYNPWVCSSGANPCVFTISIPNAATIAGDRIICALGAVNSSNTSLAISDTTEVQKCVYLGNPPVPEETATRLFIDVAFVGDGYSDSDNSMLKNDVTRHKNAISIADPFIKYQSKFRYWRLDTSGSDGKGNNFKCNDYAQCDYPLIIDELKKCDSVDRGIVLINKDQNLLSALTRSDYKIAIVPSKNETKPGGTGCDLSPGQITLHEYGHLFGAADEYYPAGIESIFNLNFWSYDSNCAASYIPYDPCVASEELDLGGWCSTVNSNPVIPPTSPCYNLSTKEDATGQSVCLKKQGCRGAIRCRDDVCKNFLAQSQCELDKRCVWEPICFDYNNTICMDNYADYNIGINCAAGTGCYPGCGFFRSTIDSVMNNKSNTMLFNERTKNLIEKKILCEISPAVACPLIQQPAEYVDPA